MKSDGKVTTHTLGKKGTPNAPPYAAEASAGVSTLGISAPGHRPGEKLLHRSPPTRDPEVQSAIKVRMHRQGYKTLPDALV